MIRSNGEFPTEASHTDISFEDLADWPPSPGWAAGTPGGDGLRLASVVFGDPVAGPMLTLWSVPPDKLDRPPAPPHSHGTDTLQVALRGALHFTHRAFGPGEFRFNVSAKAYGGERHGTKGTGTWTVEMMADRRGWLMRPVASELLVAMRAGQEQAIAELGDLTPVVFPVDQPGPSTLRTSVGSPGRSGELAGSFDEADRWPSLAGCQAVVAEAGDGDVGPVCVLLRAAPRAVALPPMSAPCDLLILPVRGDFRVGDTTYGVGRLRVHAEGHPLPAVTAGAGGGDLIVVIADRRVVRQAADSWLGAVRDLVAAA